MKRSLVLVLLLFLFCTPKHADVRFSQITLKDGLSQSSVKAIAQDQYGYLWFGTADGLNQYDGYEIKQYRYDHKDPNSIISNDISCLYSNPFDSTLWIGSEKSGISAYKRENDQFIQYHSAFSPKANVTFGEINQIYASSKDSLWVASGIEGLFLFDQNTNAFKTINFKLKEAVKRIRCIQKDSNNQLWLGTSNGLYVIDLNQGDIERNIKKVKNKLVCNASIRSFKFDLKGNIYIATENNGLIKYQSRTDKVIQHFSTDNSALPTNMLNDVLITNKGEVWTASKAGLSYLSQHSEKITNHFHNPYQKHSLSDNETVCLFEDNAGILWIGTFIGGVNNFDPNFNRFSTYNNFFSNPETDHIANNVYSICMDNNKSIWMNTPMGLIELENDFFKTESKNSAKKHVDITFGDLLYNKNAGLFYSNEHEIVLRKKDGTTEKISSKILEQTGQKVSSFLTALTDSDGTIWFSSVVGLIKLDLESESFKFIKPKGDSKTTFPTYIISMIENAEGQLMLGSRDGFLYLFDRHTEELSQVYPSEKHNGESKLFTEIHTIIESQSQTIWLGTSSGLFKYNQSSETLSRPTDNSEHLLKTIYGILEDDEGRIWCTTNNGLTTYSPRTDRIQHYTYQDGLQSNEFNMYAFFESEDGVFYLGGINGLNVFKPENIQANSYIPQVMIESMEILYEPINHKTHPDILTNDISFTKEVTLHYDESTFSFQYAALSYSQSSKNQYKYILEGYDKKWINAGSRRIASYTNIPHGTYTFKVMGSNNDGVWNDEYTAIIINIPPPFYRTKWFIILLLLCIIALVYTIIFLRTYNIKRQNLILTERVNKKTETLNEQKLQIEKQNDALLKINSMVVNKNKLLSEQHSQIKVQNENLKELSDKVEEANRAKLQFFTDISHEFLTPLTLITAPLQNIIDNFSKTNSNQVIKQLKTAYTNASKLMILIQQLLDFRKIETNNMKLDVSQIDAISFIKHITSLFEDLSRKKNITLQSSFSNKEITIWADPKKLEMILLNLLSNAFKNTEAGGNISVQLDLQSENILIIKVSDTGVGIEKDQLSNIFNRFYQDKKDNHNSVGHGIGLSIVKSFVDLHNGEIAVSSEPNIETIFTISLPISDLKDKASKNKKSNNSVNEVFISDESETVALEKIDENEDTNKQELLVIEDNTSLANFLFNTLSNDYKVELAESAEKGLEMINKHQPDLILCDINLPDMNGIQLCNKVKSDIKTTHIPLILLTALSDIKYQLEGLSSGADDYITKPFNLQILKLKIQKQIDYRIELQSKFLRDSFVDKSKEEDQELLKQITEIVKDNISDFDFNVKSLCTEVNLSRSTIYRKIHDNTNLSIQEFIRSIRLRKASELLAKDEYKINEIAYMVGFSDPSYFTRCFTQLFKYSPREYINKYRN
ncbi:two-component regulator propeller domain-containing protein [Carboxylicivirga sp. N1Y90]|uniref:hybrid sensor histidine kinase/response regulator transcription factor n=1 Tax=Carboxylicivirga fragile TaxID=3417571 RepID=UPI003D325AE7|nr:response regulator [Marinilabiliaceae bacterium N1Y90]